jgi:hypothetical protein
VQPLLYTLLAVLLSQVHAVLLEQLDLVPSKGGIEAAGLRFMQLQVRTCGGGGSGGM